MSRIRTAKITLLEDDAELVAQADIILSIVPPRDAIATARRIKEACHSPAGVTARNARRGTTAAPLNLTYIDLNAISTANVHSINTMLCPKLPEQPPTPPPKPMRRHSSLLSRLPSYQSTKELAPEPIPLAFIDGAIIGPPPTQDPETKEWSLPSIVLSGPSIPTSLAPGLPQLLNVTHISPNIGFASILKSCFSGLTKGLTALSMLSITTAHSTSLLPHLTSHLEKYSPATLSLVSKSLPAMPPKAYRWVDEMRQIGETFSGAGDFPEARCVFDGFADLYQLMAEETELGKERKKGKEMEDVATALQTGIRKKRKRDMMEGGADLNLTWRGSWA